MTKEQVDIEMAAHGGTVVEIRKRQTANGRSCADVKLNRRITADTEMEITGPAAGHDRMKTNADPTGTQGARHDQQLRRRRDALGHLAQLPRRTSTAISAASCRPTTARPATTSATACRKAAYDWGKFHDRFDVAQGAERAEPLRLGRRDRSVRSRTRCRRSARRSAASSTRAPTGIVAKDGRVVFYLGDDERFDYVYKFVTAGTFNPHDRAANWTCSTTARSTSRSSTPTARCEWLPLVHGQGPLTEANGFASQADVLIETRRAADLLGATKMDRPEDIEPNAVNGKVYVMLTNNTRRKAEQVDAANPRADNAFGHIIEMMPRPAATSRGDQGHVGNAGEVRRSHRSPRSARPSRPATTANGWFGMPDNCAVDRPGRLWVATDGNNAKATGRADGLWAVETEGEARGTSKHFFRVPVGAEMCGPFFTPDDETLFVAVQHPGEAARNGRLRPPVQLRGPVDALAGLQGRHAAAAVGRRHHQAGRRQDRLRVFGTLMQRLQRGPRVL